MNDRVRLGRQTKLRQEPAGTENNIAVVVGTYNRLEYLRKCIASVLRETSRPFTLYVTDAGSTDGTIEYLKSISDRRVVPVFVGRKLGQARAYNEVFQSLDAKYVCWISDDNEIVNGGLDVAASILDADPAIGMVALKVRDMQGPFVEAPYIGGVSKLGILNVNQGMLREEVLRNVGYFSEEFRDYGIDPDLTTKVILSGHDVVYTRQVAIHHSRLWPDNPNSSEHIALEEKHRRGAELLHEKYRMLRRHDFTWIWKRALWYVFRRVRRQQFDIDSTGTFLGLMPRDWNNILATRYISIFDPIRTRNKPYHFRQHCPRWQRDRILANLFGNRGGTVQLKRPLVLRLLDRIKRRFGALRSAGTNPQVAGLPDWGALINSDIELWRRARKRAAVGPRVLIATNVGGHVPVSIMESFLALALTWRSASVTTLLCDGALPACLKAEHVDLPDAGDIVERRLSQKLCGVCRQRGESAVRDLGTDVVRIGELLEKGQKDEARRIAEAIAADEIAGFRYDGLAVGEHALAGALRYYACGNLAREPQGEAVLRRYLEAAILSVHATRRVIRERKIEIAVFHHGLYVPQGLVGEVCRSMGVRVVNWFVAYRTGTFLFSHDDTYHHTLMSEPSDTWVAMHWDETQRASIVDYLKSRWHGTRDWISFHERPDTEFANFARAAGIDLQKPMIGLLTNVVWDAQLHYPANAFPSMIDWVLKTIGYFERRPDLQLVIRVHPAEIRGTLRSRQPIVEEIRSRLPTLPANVFIIPPESPVSTYAAMERCDSVIIYGTKTGVELTSVGIPTIVAGEAWIRNKGLTRDAASEEDYFQILDQLPFGARLDAATVDKARRYAFHFFFRRMIPLPFMRPTGAANLYMPSINSLTELDPGRYPGLDVICDGILQGAPFVYRAEDIGLEAGGGT